MVSSFVIVHLPFIILPIYFIFYTIVRVYKHWSDGKEPAKTSNSRFAIKLTLTILLALLDIAHVADYSPNQHYNAEETALRVGFYGLSACAWFFSALLVFFDFIRRLKSQWRGQRMYWILELFSYIVILLLNTTFDHYDYSGDEFYKFSLIQITCHALSVFFCLILSYYSLFRPDDFTVLSNDVYLRLNNRTSHTEDSFREDSEVSFKIIFTGFKTKQIGQNSVSHYKFSIQIKDTMHEISKTLQDFEVLANLLLNSQFNFQETLPEFNYSEILHLSPQERGKELGNYLHSVCRVEFLTPDLLNFLRIEGNLKEILGRKFSEIYDGKNESNFVMRSESISQNYYSPRLEPGAADSIFLNSSNLQWIVRVKLLRPDQDLSKDVDFLVQCEIPVASFKKTTGYQLKDFSLFHKTLSKILSPSSLYFTAKSIPASVKGQNEQTLNKLQTELEHYLLEVLNDPAFLCKEALDFIKCDVEVSDLLASIPGFSYSIQDNATWENHINEDHSHVTLYNIWINQKNLTDSSQKEWKFLRRYREYDFLHNRLVSRIHSPLLKNYALRLKDATWANWLSLPNLPSKSIAPLSTSSEIEMRKQGLVGYLKELTGNPLVVTSYAFREFVDSTVV